MALNEPVENTAAGPPRGAPESPAETPTQTTTTPAARAPAAESPAAPSLNDPAAGVKEVIDDIDKLKAKIKVRKGVVSKPVCLKDVVFKVKLDFPRVVFKRGFSITDSVFEKDVDFSFCTFEGGVELSASQFEGRVDFRAARVKGDFDAALASFGRPAHFDDLYVDEVLCAEGSEFRDEVTFNRIDVRKSALFCGALLRGSKAARTRFRAAADFRDAHFQGPTYFSGARFEAPAYFDRARVDSSAFFNCDLLDKEIIPSQPRHEEHAPPRREVGIAKPTFFTTAFESTASFIGARVAGSISFSGACFGLEGGPQKVAGDAAEVRADFRRVQIDGTALFDPFHYPALYIFQRVHFHCDAAFWNACIRGAAKFEAAYFGGAADFEHVQVGRRAYFQAVEYGGDLFRTEFRGKANFIDADVKGSVEFDRAQFYGDAVFERLTTGGSMFFRAGEKKDSPEEHAGQEVVPVTFAGAARFVSARVRGNAEFDSAQFNSADPGRDGAARPKKEINFARMEVGGNLYFRPWSEEHPVVRFSQKARFMGTHVKGRAEFSGTQFEGGADFTGMRVEGNAEFDCRLHLKEDDEPSSDQPAGNQAAGAAPKKEKNQISEVRFSQRARFNGATFLGRADFRKAEFVKEADFTGVSSAAEVSFEEARFRSDVSFREARLTSVKFDHKDTQGLSPIRRACRYLRSRPKRKSRDQYRDEYRKAAEAEELERQFGGRVDLSGSTYERIEAKLTTLLEAMKRKPSTPAPTDSPRTNDRHAYTQMSKALRAVGEDRRAEFVYVEQRLGELKGTARRLRADVRNWRPWGATRGLANLLLDCFQWAVAQFGVQPERLFFISLLVVVAGARIFSFDGAVQNKDPDPEALPTATIVTAEQPWQLKMNKPDKNSKNLLWPDSLKFSVSQFLPVVDIPSGSRWRAAPDRSFWVVSPGLLIPYDVYGSVHRVLGAILVPLLLAAVAASLYRRFKSDF